MFAQTITIDQSRRIKLPKKALDALGVKTKDEIVLELTETGIMIKPKRAAPLTDQLASINLPVSDWEQMKQETEAGLLLKINEDIPGADRKRFKELHHRRNTLQEDERKEYLQLISLIENKDAERVWYLAELAELRGVSVHDLMGGLEIFQANDV